MIFVIFLLGLFITAIAMTIISENKGVIVLNSSNIVELLENNRTFGQNFKIEKGTYEVCKKFYVGYNSNSLYDKLYADNFFIIYIKNNENHGYYMATKIRTEKNKENSILTSLENGETVDLTGMVSEITATYGTTKVIDEFYSELGNDKNDILEYCINAN